MRPGNTILDDYYDNGDYMYIPHPVPFDHMGYGFDGTTCQHDFESEVCLPPCRGFESFLPQALSSSGLDW